MTRARFNAILGWVPVGLSLAAFLVTVIVLSTGWERGLSDEGAAAHLWQLFLVLEVPFIGAFIATTDWRRHGVVIRRIGLIAVALLLALAPVAIFKL